MIATSLLYMSRNFEVCNHLFQFLMNFFLHQNFLWQIALLQCEARCHNGWGHMSRTFWMGKVENFRMHFSWRNAAYFLQTDSIFHRPRYFNEERAISFLFEMNEEEWPFLRRNGTTFLCLRNRMEREWAWLALDWTSVNSLMILKKWKIMIYEWMDESEWVLLTRSSVCFYALLALRLFWCMAISEDIRT